MAGSTITNQNGSLSILFDLVLNSGGQIEVLELSNIARRNSYVVIEICPTIYVICSTVFVGVKICI